MMMTQVNQDALVDKLCERMTVEDGGVKLYEALIAKLPEGDTQLIARLRRFQAQEAKHRDMLRAHLEQMGAGNVETPSARMARLEGEAYLKLVAEAESTPQLMNILLTVELMDENAWELLINIGRDYGDEEMVLAFNVALREEKEHLRTVRGLFAEMARAGLEVAAEKI